MLTSEAANALSDKQRMVRAPVAPKARVKSNARATKHRSSAVTDAKGARQNLTEGEAIAQEDAVRAQDAVEVEEEEEVIPTAPRPTLRAGLDACDVISQLASLEIDPDKAYILQQAVRRFRARLVSEDLRQAKRQTTIANFRGPSEGSQSS
jgi:hypothetical protein